MKAHGGVDGRTALVFLNIDTRWGKNVQLYTPTTLLPGKSTGIHSIESLGGPLSWSGCFIGDTREECMYSITLISVRTTIVAVKNNEYYTT
jgi:hypothetical protein